MNPADKPRLTDNEKKQNHIVSEQKRRQAIREGFDKLAAIVPGMEGQGRSEAVVLQATVEYLRQQLSKKEELRCKAHDRGIPDEQFELLYSVARDTSPRSGKYGGGIQGASNVKEEK